MEARTARQAVTFSRRRPCLPEEGFGGLGDLA